MSHHGGEPTLIFTESGAPVQVGDACLVDGKLHTVVYFRPPLISIALAKHRYGLTTQSAGLLIHAADMRLDWSEATWQEIDDVMMDVAKERGIPCQVQTLTNLSGDLMRLD